MKIDTFIYWGPRVAAIVLIFFLALFAFDVFEPGYTFSYYLIAFLIHLIPNFLLFAVLLIAWNNERLGGIVFILTSIFFTFFYHTYRLIWSFLLISLPILVIGILFFYSSFRKK